MQLVLQVDVSISDDDGVLNLLTRADATTVALGGALPMQLLQYAKQRCCALP